MRRIYQVTGSDRLGFLQGLVSNDLRPLERADGIVWAALLTPQGKYLADFFVVALGGALLLDIDAGLAEATVKRLLMYRLRADVAIAPRDLAVSRSLVAGDFADPRHAGLGWRSYGATRPDDENWDALRVAHGIPESGVELIPNDSYLLENGFERLHGVDFRKGCYIGQEVTARMKHKTELRKGLVRVTIAGAAPIGTPIMAGDRQAGTLFTQSGGQGLAHLRLDWAVPGMTAGDANILDFQTFS